MNNSIFDSKKTRRLLSIIFIAAALVCVIVGIFILPDTVVMQITASGKAGNIMPKPFAMILPFGLTALFSIWFYGGEKKSFLGMTAGIMVFIFIFVVNLI